MSDRALQTTTVLFVISVAASVVDLFYDYPSTIGLYSTIGLGGCIILQLAMRRQRRNKLNR